GPATPGPATRGAAPPGARTPGPPTRGAATAGRPARGRATAGAATRGRATAGAPTPGRRTPGPGTRGADGDAQPSEASGPAHRRSDRSGRCLPGDPAPRPRLLDPERRRGPGLGHRHDRDRRAVRPGVQ